MAVGEDWRLVRSACSTREEWLQYLPRFIQTVCKEWALPPILDMTPSPQDSPEPSTKKTRKADHRLVDCPTKHAEDTPCCSSAGSMDSLLPDECPRRFLFVVDCKPLQRIVCGHSVLLAPELRPLFTRIVTNVTTILDISWLPPDGWRDPVDWRRRERNKVADYLVNYTMDVKESWSESFAWQFQGVPLNECNLAIHSDGGSRRDSCSASAWIIEAGTYIDEKRT